MTLTGNLPKNFGKLLYGQPLLSVSSDQDGPGGNPDTPLLPADNPMTLIGINVRGDDAILVDGQVVDGTIDCFAGNFLPSCSSGLVTIELDTVPGAGLHLLQVKHPSGPLSPELPICVANDTFFSCL
jgi:hypothetical protein